MVLKDSHLTCAMTDGFGRLNGDHTHATCMTALVETRAVTSQLLPRFKHSKYSTAKLMLA